MKRFLPLIIVISVLAILIPVALTLLPNQQTLVISGKVQGKEIKNASRVGGRVKEILVKVGDSVEKGQPLIVFDNLELTSQLNDAKAALTQAQAKRELLVQGADREDIRQALAQVNQATQNLRIVSSGARPEEIAQAQAKVTDAEGRTQSAKAAYDNSKQMLAEGIISQQKFDDIKSQYESAQSALSAARANLKLLKTGARPEQVNIARSQMAAARAQYDKLLKGAKPGEVKIASAVVEQAQSAVDAFEAQMGETIVKAPISGTVNVLSVSEGELVPPSRPIVSIIDYRHLWADIYIPERHLDSVRIGQAVKVVAPAFKNAEFQGRVAFINPKSEFVPSGGGSADNSEQASFRVKVDIENQEAGKPQVIQKRQLLPGMQVQVEFPKD